MERIEQMLFNQTSDQLTQLCKIARIKGYSGTKEYKVKLLCEFYKNENWVKEVFDSLTNYEQDMVKCIVQNKYHPDKKSIEEILVKHQKRRYISDYFDRDSKVNLLYINEGSIPMEFREKLDSLVEPLKMEIHEVKEQIDPDEYDACIVGREKRVQDFDEFIKTINISKIKATKAKQQMPKSALIKIHKKLEYPDVLKYDEIDFGDIRSVEDTTVSNGIMNLLTNSSIIDVKKGEFVIKNEFCEDYEKLDNIEKVKYLVNGYIEKSSTFINECERIESGNFRMRNQIMLLGEARKMILEYLKKCPIEKWVDMNEFKKYIRINEFLFLRPYTGNVLIKDQYYNSYYNYASHEEFENPFIDVVFMEYLATLGIVDVVMDKMTDEGEYKEFLEVEYFKLTDFGSCVLGMAKEEEEKNDDSDIEVTDQFEIIVNETSRKLKYELYFDRIFSKISEEPLIYKMDFQGMVRALDLGLKLKDIYEYIQLNCKNDMPKNVQIKFENWIKSSNKIKIKTITILEVDKESFDDIMANEKIKSQIDSIKEVIVLKNGKADSMKEALNKNGFFCKK